MKVLALILFCVAAAQARSTGVQTTGARAELGENPWLVHLRVAVSTSGFLDSCTGSLIDARWVLTSASCVRTARFIWVRYGVVDVFSPSLVTETSTVRLHATDDVALISLNRHVLNPESENIAPVVLAGVGDAVPESGSFCGFGEEDGAAGQSLTCISLSVSEQEDGSIVAESDEGQASRFDLGGALVQDGVQYGILVKEADEDNAAVFLNPANYRDWIQREAGIVLPSTDSDDADNEDE